MRPHRHRRVLLLVTSVSAALLASTVAVAAEPTSAPANTPSSAPAVDQHGPTIKDTYRNHFLIGMAGDLPGSYSDVERSLVKENFHIGLPRPRVRGSMRFGGVYPLTALFGGPVSERPSACMGSMTRRVSHRLGHYNHLAFAQIQGNFQAGPIDAVAYYRTQTC